MGKWWMLGHHSHAEGGVPVFSVVTCAEVAALSVWSMVLVGVY